MGPVGRLSAVWISSRLIISILWTLTGTLSALCLRSLQKCLWTTTITILMLVEALTLVLTLTLTLTLTMVMETILKMLVEGLTMVMGTFLGTMVRSRMRIVTPVRRIVTMMTLMKTIHQRRIHQRRRKVTRNAKRVKNARKMIRLRRSQKKNRYLTYHFVTYAVLKKIN